MEYLYMGLLCEDISQSYTAVHSIFLKYFKKGSETWGTPFDMSLLSNNEKVELPNEFELLPNPTSDNIQINSSHPINDGQLLIYNIAGQLIFQEKISYHIKP